MKFSELEVGTSFVMNGEQYTKDEGGFSHYGDYFNAYKTPWNEQVEIHADEEVVLLKDYDGILPT